MRNIKAITTSIVLAGAIFSATAPHAHADEPAFVSVGAGSYDWNRKKDQGVEVRLEYRHDKKILGPLKPFVALAATNSSSSFFVGAGVLMDIYFGKRLVLTPSFAPHYYNGGNTKLDLDYALEFRSQLELAYRFDDRSRLGMAVSHYSNASLGKTNPGTESALIYYSVPVDFFN
ncbi:MAG: acyloxyacyl hydrolase [Magnetovibrio sp.]|nr:acyloxyacyl hydrolase [Magnetovibrio sp.]